MVPNQRQLFIVVSDWGSYLGCHFPFWFCGLLSMCSCMSALVVNSGTLFKCSSFNKRRMYSNHTAPWSPRYNERDRLTSISKLTHLDCFVYRHLKIQYESNVWTHLLIQGFFYICTVFYNVE